jgi:TM2 domain-containing membrane protein YozV
MKKTTQVILLFIAITIGSLSTSQAAFPIKQAQTSNQTITTTAAPIIADQVINEAFASEIKAANTTKGGGGKSQIVAAILCFFLGWLGIHRFYLGYTWQGIVQLLTGGGLGLWTLIDFVRILIGDLEPKGGSYDKTF